jgi:hypothetical protein
MTEVRVFQMKARSFPWPYACHTWFHLLTEMLCSY